LIIGLLFRVSVAVANATGAGRRSKERKMKYFRMLALATVAAAALTALFGTGAALGTVLCKTTTNSCAGTYPAKTEIHAVLPSETSYKFESPDGTTNYISCNEVTMKSSTATEGSSTTTVDANISTWTWGKCSPGTPATVKTGRLEIHYAGSGNGTLTLKEFEITLPIFGVSCVYSAGTGIHLGVLTESTEAGAKMDIGALTPKSGGGFLCPEKMRMTGDLFINSPYPLYVAGS
jgi:hypothetical protein